MLRAAVIAVLLGIPTASLAGTAEDALANCLIAKTTVAMALDGQALSDAYPAAWDACDDEANAVSDTSNADLSPIEGVDEYAYRTLQEISDRLDLDLQPGFNLTERKTEY